MLVTGFGQVPEVIVTDPGMMWDPLRVALPLLVGSRDVEQLLDARLRGRLRSRLGEEMLVSGGGALLAVQGRYTRVKCITPLLTSRVASALLGRSRRS
jgi:hypothetical protein